MLCTYIPYIPGMDLIPCMDYIFCNKGTVPTTMYLHSLHFTVWVTTTPMYLHSLGFLHFPAFHSIFCVSMHGFVCGSPLLPCIDIPCMDSISCIGDLFAQMAQHPLPYTYILLISLCGSLCGSSPPPDTYIVWL